MKATLIYGSDTQACFKRFEQIIKAIQSRGWEIVNLQKDTKTLVEKLRSTSLFENRKLFVLQSVNIVSDKDLIWLKKNQDFDANLLIFIEGNLPIKLKNALGKNLKLEKFDLPVKIFQFLDSIYPGNSKICLSLFHEVLDTQPVEMVLAMMATTLRDIYWIKTDTKSFKTSPWKAGKLISQASKFNLEQLKNFVSKLADADVKTKTSDTNLADQLDLIIAANLK